MRPMPTDSIWTSRSAVSCRFCCTMPFVRPSKCLGAPGDQRGEQGFHTRYPLMRWSGRAPARQQEKLARGAKDKEHAMSYRLITESPCSQGLIRLDRMMQPLPMFDSKSAHHAVG